jgi:restriction endonuclease S subunit
VKFGEVVRQVKNRADPETSGLERFVAGEHMDSDNLKIRHWGNIRDGYLGPAFHMRFRPGQVLYGSRRTYLRKVALADFEGICANTTFVLESADPELLLPELLPFVLQTEGFHAHSKRESKGSVNPYVNFSDLAWYEFELPPQVEQHRLARALASAEGAIQMLTNAAESTLVAAQAFSGEMFRGNSRADMVPHPRLERVAAGWDVRTIGELVESSQYGLSTAPEPTGDFPILRMMNLVDGLAVENDIRFVNLTDDLFQNYRLDHGDVLFNRTNSIDLVGRTGVYTLAGDHVFASYLIRLRVNRDVISPEYLTEYLNGPLGRQQVLSFATKGVSQANVNASNLAKVLIPLPPRDVQDRIVADLGKIKSAGRGLRGRVEVAERLKAILMRELDQSEAG